VSIACLVSVVKSIQKQGRIVHSGEMTAFGNDEELQQRLLGLSMAVGA
jgi:hypothetical protein